MSTPHKRFREAEAHVRAGGGRLLPRGLALAAALGFFLASPLFAQTLVLSRFGSQEQERLGENVANVMDLDGDGYDEVAATRHTNANQPELKEWAIFSGFDLSLRLVLAAPQEDAGHLRAVGDVDLDGVPDLAVGYPESRVAGIAAAGVLRVYSGATGSVLFTIAGSTAFEQLTYTEMAGPHGAVDAGDLNQDGVPDLATLARLSAAGGHGEARVYSGANQQLLSKKTIGQNESLKGIEPYFDLQSDGTLELLLNLYATNSNYKNRIAVWNPLTGAYIVSPTHKMEVYAMRRLADLGGDGRPEVVLRTNDLNAKVATYNLFLFQPYWTSNGSFGLSLGTPRDVDLDGLPDVVVSGSEQAYVISGATGTDIYAVDGENWSDMSDHALLGDLVTDLVGNGRADLLVGAPAMTPSPVFPYDGHEGMIALFASPGSCGSVVTFGPVCPGSGGWGPLLSVEGCAGAPMPLSIRWEAAAANAQGFLLVGTQIKQQPLFGCSLLVDPVLLAIPWPTGSGSGEVKVPGPTGLSGLKAVLQLIVLDPAGPQGLAASNGVEIHFP